MLVDDSTAFAPIFIIPSVVSRFWTVTLPLVAEIIAPLFIAMTLPDWLLICKRTLPAEAVMLPAVKVPDERTSLYELAAEPVRVPLIAPWVMLTPD